MNVTHKLEGFMEMALEEAKAERDRVLNEIEQDYAKACAEITVQAQKNADEKYKEACYKAEQLKNKEILRATTESKKALIELRNQFLEEIFENVLQRLHTFIHSDHYLPYLINEIKKIPKYNDYEIILCKNDMKYATQIEQTLCVSVVESNEDFIGGIKFHMKNKNVINDNSFKTRLIDAKHNYNTFKIID